jgi:uncharacterized Fe-S cluster protein YjdI
MASVEPEIETAEGKEIIIEFETSRCIHARFCVLQQPGVFKANVVGPWLAPDDAPCAEELVAAAQNCPSGAIRYRRKGGGPEKRRLRQRDPAARERALAVRAAIVMAGQPAGFRATLCRCGHRRTSPIATAPMSAPPSPPPEAQDRRRDGAREARRRARDSPAENGPLAIHGSVG